MKNRKEYGKILLKAQKYLSDGILIYDAKQKDIPLIFINKSVSKISGYSNKELIGRSYRFFESKETDIDNLTKYRDSFKRKKVSTVDLYFERKDKKKILCRISISPIPDTKGRTEYFLCILRDITEAKEKLLNKVKLSVVEATLRTVNDIVFNYFNNIQYFRWEFEKYCNKSKLKLDEFDNLNNHTINRLKKINELKEYKEKKLTEKLAVLLYA